MITKYANTIGLGEEGKLLTATCSRHCQVIQHVLLRMCIFLVNASVVPFSAFLCDRLPDAADALTINGI